MFEISRDEFTGAIERAISNTRGIKSDEIEELRRVANEADQVVFGSTFECGIGCPLQQAGFWNVTDEDSTVEPTVNWASYFFTAYDDDMCQRLRGKYGTDEYYEIKFSDTGPVVKIS